MNQEEDILTIISASGEANNCSFQALDAIASGNFEAAKAAVAQGRKNLTEAHHVQTNYLFAECDEDAEHGKVSLLMVHAQDHMMNAQLTMDLTEKMIDIFSQYQHK